MAGGSRDLRYNVTVDASDASSSLKKLSNDVKKTTKDIEGSFDDSATAGDRFKATVDQLSGKLTTEFKAAAQAADKLGSALKEAGSEMDVGDAISDLKQMGFTFDEITADADKFAASLKQLDDVKATGVKELDAVAPGLATKLGDVEKSADSSKNVLANMVGNSAQDLGELGGVAGSAGVLIGQMAEYMADAKFEGEKFGQIVKNFAAVAGPAAALGLVIATVSGFMEKQAASAAAAAARTEELGTAMEGAADDAVGIADALKSNLDPLRDFDAGLALLGSSSVKAVNDLGRSIPLVGRLFEDTSRDVVAAMADAGVSLYDFSAAVEGSEDDRFKFLLNLRTMVSLGAITEDQYNAVAGAMDEYRKSTAAARQGQSLFNVTAKDANAILGELVAKADPLKQFTDQWKTLFDDMADGSIDTAEAADAINFLSEKLGLTKEEVIALGREHLDEKMKADAEAAKEAAKAHEEAAKAAREHADALRETNRELTKTDDVLETIAGREEAINAVFDFTTHPIDTASTFRDLLQAIGKDLPEAVKKVKGKIPPIIDFNDVRLDPLLDAFDDIRPDFQAKLTETFSVGGAPAATALIENLVAAMQKSTGLSRAQIFQLLGLDPSGSVEATIKPFVEESNKAAVSAELDALATGPDDNGWAAEIKAALDAGEITPQVAQALINDHVPEGVTMPTGIEVTPEAETTARQWAMDHELILPTTALPPADWGVEPPPLSVPTVLAPPDLGPWGAADAGSLGVDIAPVSVPVTLTTAVDTKDADATLNNFIKKDRELAPVDVTADTALADMSIDNLTNAVRSTTVDVKANTQPFLIDGNAARTTIGKPLTVTVKYQSDGTVHAGGGTVGRSGGIGGEAGPEFIKTPNGRTSLIDGPMVLPPGTQVTSVRRTRQLLSGRPATPGRSRTDLGASRGVLRTAVAPVVTNTKTAAHQLDHLVRPRTARINVALVPSSVLVRVNGGG